MNPANHKNFSSLSKSIAAASRDFDLGQDGQHSKAKSVDSFMKGCQATLMDFTTILATLIVNILHCLELQKKSTHELLISYFMLELTKVVKHPKFRSQCEKHQCKCSSLVCKNIAYLHQLFALLGEVSAHHVKQEILTAGRNLPADKHDLVIKIMGVTIVRMKEGTLENNIVQFYRESAPHY